MTGVKTERVVLITGCSTGIGLASAIAFADAGDRVYASTRSLSKADSLHTAAEQRAANLFPVELDVTSPNSVKRAVDTLTEREGRLDLVINNAGILKTGAFETLSNAAIRDVMETNFFGALNVTRAVLPTMRVQRRGHIMMISSLSGWAGLAGDTAYAASKFALEGFTEALRQEVGRWGIRLSLVEPGGVKTGLVTSGAQDCPSDADPYTALNRSLLENLSESGETGAEPEDVARELLTHSLSQGDQFRRPVGALAEQLKATLFRADDAERNDILKSAAQLDWWLRGDAAPPSN